MEVRAEECVGAGVGDGALHCMIMSLSPGCEMPVVRGWCCITGLCICHTLHALFVPCSFTVIPGVCCSIPTYWHVVLISIAPFIGLQVCHRSLELA
jgi:hypothetical protein